jgi:hypothetical protein
MTNATRTPRAETLGAKPEISADTRGELKVRLGYRALEQRMVFDAALGATVEHAAAKVASAEVPVHSEPHTQAALDVAALHAVLDEVHNRPGVPQVADQFQAWVQKTVATAQPTETAEPEFCATGHATPSNDLAPPPAGVPETVVFIDTRVAHADTIITHLAPGARVVMIDQSSGGLEQIATSLSAYQASGHTIASIQIFSHGAEAELQLGSDVLTNDTLANHSAALRSIGHALVTRGDILIYGCDVAAGADGDRFIATIAALTGDDVAASTDATGAAAKGGNWVLEKQTGMGRPADPVRHDDHQCHHANQRDRTAKQQRRYNHWHANHHDIRQHDVRWHLHDHKLKPWHQQRLGPVYG